MWRATRWLRVVQQQQHPLAAAAPRPLRHSPYRHALRALGRGEVGLRAAAEVFDQFERYYREQQQQHASGALRRRYFAEFCGVAAEVEPLAVLLLKVLCDLQRLEDMRFLFTQYVLELDGDSGSEGTTATLSSTTTSVELFNVYLMAIAMTDTYNRNEVENVVDLMHVKGVQPDVVTRLSVLILYLRLGQDCSPAWWVAIRDEVQRIIDAHDVTRYPLLALRVQHCFATVLRVHHDADMVHECLGLLRQLAPQRLTTALLVPYLVLSVLNAAAPPSYAVETLHLLDEQLQRERHQQQQQHVHSEDNVATQPALSSETTAFRLLAKCAKWHDVASARAVRAHVRRTTSATTGTTTTTTTMSREVIAPEHAPLASLLYMATLALAAHDAATATAMRTQDKDNNKDDTSDYHDLLVEALDVIERERLSPPYDTPAERPKLLWRSRRMVLLTCDALSELARAVAARGVAGVGRVLQHLLQHRRMQQQQHSDNDQEEDEAVAAAASATTATVHVSTATLDVFMAAYALLRDSDAAEALLARYQSDWAAQPRSYTYACLMQAYLPPHDGHYSDHHHQQQQHNNSRDTGADGGNTAVTSSCVVARVFVALGELTRSGVDVQSDFLSAALDVLLAHADMAAALRLCSVGHVRHKACVTPAQSARMLRGMALTLDVHNMRRLLHMLRTTQSPVDARCVAQCVLLLRRCGVACDDLTRL